MSTIEGGMICTNDNEIFQQARMLRSHGMVREANDESLKETYYKNNPDLHPEFIFSFPAYNVRNTEIGGIMGLSQLKRLDDNIERRTVNLHRFLDQLNSEIYRTDFKLEGSSNYAFNLILKEPNDALVIKLMEKMKESGLEYRRGSAGGGNQTRQPYLKDIVPTNHYKNFPETEHIHFYGFYIGNFPDLKDGEIDDICRILNSVE